MYGHTGDGAPVTDILKSSTFTMKLKTAANDENRRLEITINTGSIAWSAEPVVNSAGDTTQLMVLNGTAIMTSTVSPIKLVLVNARSTAY